jgi:hypothetical protein
MGKKGWKKTYKQAKVDRSKFINLTGKKHLTLGNRALKKRIRKK